MKRNLLTITSTLSVLLFTIHVADDIVRGFEKGGLQNLTAVPMFTLWLYGTLVLAERRSGYIIKLLGSLLGLAVPILHMSGKGLAAVAKSPRGGFFCWTILALGITALLSLVLSTQGLWRLRRPAGERAE